MNPSAKAKKKKPRIANDFCTSYACPLTLWVVDSATKTFGDSLGDQGTYTEGAKKVDTFEAEPYPASGVKCEYVGKAGGKGTIAKEAKPGTFTCSDGETGKWWLGTIEVE